LGRQKTEDRGQRTEDRGQRREEGGGRKSFFDRIYRIFLGLINQDMDSLITLN
jgi:hypothetical protein